MRKGVTIFLLFLSSAVLAQPQGFNKVSDVTAFRSSLAKANDKVQNITSDFKQVKNISLLEEKINSNGKFYLKKPDKVRIEYTQPFKYIIVMNGNKIRIEDEGKSSTVNTGKMMQSINRVMTDCMQGTVFTNPDFKVEVYKNNKQYLLSLSPVNSTMKNLFQQIDVYMNNSSYDVEKLIMTEKGGDYTLMDFYNTRHNTSMNETVFKVR